jgi:type IV pilus assembly protein PilW
MTHPIPRLCGQYRARQSGLTLIELMIAVAVATFLIGGVLTMVQSTRNTFATQNLLAQLQDNERLVMSFMAEVIEAAGYYPNPRLYTSGAVLPVAGVFTAAGQAVFGTQGAGPPGDTVTIRYGAALNDNVFNCRGTTNTGVAPYDTFVNRFWVNNAVATNPVLTCTFSSSLGATDVPLVNGVTSLQISYGVKRNPLDTQSCADTYLRASQMLAADWGNVCTVKVVVLFRNPLNPAQPPIPVTRVIAVMGTAGVNS